MLPPLQSLPVHRPPVTTFTSASVGSYDTVAGVAVRAVSDDSDITASVSSEVAPSAHDSDNTVSVGVDDARTAGSRGFSDPAAVITTSTPNPQTTATTQSLSVVMLPLLLGLEGSHTRQLPSLPTHPNSPPTQQAVPLMHRN